MDSIGFSYILIGGQAVNFWATQYSQGSEEFEQHRPFTSEDVDAMPEARRSIQKIEFPPELEVVHTEGPNDGQLAFIEAGDLRMDILSDPYGLSKIRRVVVERARDVSLDDVSFRIMDPVLLLKSKLISLVGLDQHARQDEKHVRIMLLVLHDYFISLIELLKEGGMSGRDLIKETKLALKIVRDRQAREALEQIGESLLNYMPISAFRAVEDSKFARFASSLWE